MTMRGPSSGGTTVGKVGGRLRPVTAEAYARNHTLVSRKKTRKTSRKRLPELVNQVVENRRYHKLAPFVRPFSIRLDRTKSGISFSSRGSDPVGGRDSI